jgi:hypothetical protein
MEQGTKKIEFSAGDEIEIPCPVCRVDKYAIVSDDSETAKMFEHLSKTRKTICKGSGNDALI